MNVWLCQKHYDEISIKLGYEIPVHTIANVFLEKCYFCKDMTIAIHHITLVQTELDELKEQDE